MSRLRTLLRLPSPPLDVRIPSGLLEAQRDGAAPLDPGPVGDPLDVAFVVPSFRRVSGGHTTISQAVRALEARGVRCSIWLLDDDARSAGSDEALVERFQQAFGGIRGAVHAGFSGWTGTDVLVATAWQTVPQALRLPRVKARAYFVQDHEAEFYATSAEREWATWTYRQGLHPIVASPWLADVLARDYGTQSTTFDIGVDHATYRPRDVERDGDLVLFYARASTPRRGVPLGLAALEELHRRRPGTRIALFGEAQRIRTPFPHEHLGVLGRAELAERYARAGAGLVLSLTNPSLIPHEMLACGLPCVDLASESSTAAFGPGTPVLLAPPTPPGLAEGLARLLDDPEERARRSREGLAVVAPLTWERTGEQVEAGLRRALQIARAA
jgi:hypothetical protein